MAIFKSGRPLHCSAPQPPAHMDQFPSGARGVATPLRACGRKAGCFAPLPPFHGGDAPATARCVRRDFADAFTRGAGAECLRRHIERGFASHTTRDRAPRPPISLRSPGSAGPRRCALHFVAAPTQKKVP
jgi:hypothetical protein